MSGPGASLRGCVLALCVAGAACARRVDPSVEPGALYVNLVRADGIDLVVQEDELVAAAARCADRWEASGARSVAVVRADTSESAGSPGRASRARVVLGSAASPEALALARSIGLVGREEGAADDARFHVLARELARPGDHVIACFEDPARPGLPVTLVFGNDPRALASTIDDLWPGSRPYLWLFRQSTLALEADLTLAGAVRAATIAEHALAARAEPERYRPVDAPAGLEARAERSLSVERARAYLDALSLSRARAASWTGADAEPLSVTLESSVEDYAAPGTRGVAGELASVVHSPTALRALLLPELDDGGAAAATLDLCARWGEPVHEWMREAGGVDAADAWWGRGLAEWCQALALLERPPGLEDLVSARARERMSPHLLVPLRAWLFRALRESLGPERVARLWRGEEELDLGELARVLDRRFPLVSPEDDLRERVLAARAERTRGALDHSLAYDGVHLVAPSEVGAAGYGSRAALEAIDEAARSGARAIAIPCLAAATAGPWSGRAWEPTRRFGALEGDVAIAATLTAARERGLATALFPDLCTSPAGALAGDTTRTSRADAEEFFDAYEAFVTHHALLAELCGVNLLSLGSGIEAATRVRPSPSSRKPGMEEAYAANHTGWARIVRRARQVFSGALTFSATSLAQVEAIDFWEQLDYAGVELFPSFSARDRDDDRIDDQLAVWLVRRLGELASAAPKPLLITRIGFRSTARTTSGPREAGGAADADLQARLYRGVVRGLESARAQGITPRGVLVLSWPIDARAASPLDRGYGARGKPAAAWLAPMLGAR